ncbi:putative membrane protein [Chitinophaga sp. S165]|nr:putative membrane protein [Chitinophaga sp. S165]
MTPVKTTNMFTIAHIVLIVTATMTALISGLFYAWSCSVVPGLARVSDSTYLEAMQQINRAILNPVFFMSFIGTALLLPLSTWLHYGPDLNARFWLLLLASVVYLAGTFGVTMFGNVPLNEALDAFNLSSATAQELAAQRARFEGPWNNLNIIRTIAGIVALILIILACLNPAAVTARTAAVYR